MGGEGNLCLTKTSIDLGLVPLRLSERGPSRGCPVIYDKDNSWVGLLRRNKALTRPNIRKALHNCNDPEQRGTLQAEMDRLNAKYPPKKLKTQPGPPAAKELHPLLRLIVSRMPEKPYFADDLTRGTKIRARAEALKHREIQPCLPWSRQLMPFDIDHDRRLTGDLPPPNLSIMNPKNGHRHLAIVLETPVLVGPKASTKAVQYFREIAQAVGQCWQADPHYTGLLMHNPIHGAWQVEILHSEPYQLSDFQNALRIARDMPANHPRHTATTWAESYDAEGRRNTATWQVCRWPAYSLGKSATYESVLALVEAYNAMHNSPPLPFQECKDIAKSISRYVLSGKVRGGMEPEDWKAYVAHSHRPEIQAERGRRSGEVRRQSREQERATARLMRAQGMTQQAIADALGVTQRTISAWVA